MRTLVSIGRLFSIGVFGVVISGCAMFGNGIPPEEMSKLATVEAASRYYMHSIDGQLYMRSTAHVQPGKHTFELTISCQNKQCSYQTYRFSPEAGKLYRLMPDRRILILDRNDQFQRKLGEMLPIEAGSERYANEEERHAYNKAVFERAQAQRQALTERRRLQIPQMQRRGARICQTQGQVVYIGFVESYTSEKLQIRVAEAHMSDNPHWAPGNFRSSIVWDSPLNWDLCE